MARKPQSKPSKSRKSRRLAVAVSEVQIRDLTTALWNIEDWIRSVREVLILLPEDTRIKLRNGLSAIKTDGVIPMTKGCPPPCIEPPVIIDPCEDEKKEDKRKRKR